MVETPNAPFFSFYIQIQFQSHLPWKKDKKRSKGSKGKEHKDREKEARGDKKFLALGLIACKMLKSYFRRSK